jgi:hypothetical protein
MPRSSKSSPPATAKYPKGQKHGKGAHPALSARPKSEVDVRKGSVGGEEWAVLEARDSKLDNQLKKTLDNMNPKQVALFCAWVVNGRNISAAGRQIGYAEQHARGLFSKHPAFLAARERVEDILSVEDEEWIESLPEARRTLRQLLKARDEKVRLWAAQDIVNRAEGKPVAKVDMTVREERPSLTDGEMQLAISIMQQTGRPFPEVREWIRQHPEEVRGWVAQHATPTGTNLSALPAPKQESAVNGSGSSPTPGGLPDPIPDPPSPSQAILGPLEGIPEETPIPARQPEPTHVPLMAYVD